MEEQFLDIGRDSEQTINPWSHNKKKQVQANDTLFWT